MRPAPPIRAAAAGGPALAASVAAPPRVRVDPRISARRIAVLRDEGRRRLRRLLWLGGAFTAVAAALGSTRTPLLDLDRIDVRGAERLGVDGVREAIASAGVRDGQPLVDLDLAGAEAALESLPAVAEARVHRRWPGAVEIEVVERQAVASVTVAGGQALVGADGVVIAVADPAADPAEVSGVVPVDGPADLVAGDRFDAEARLAVAAALPEPMRPLIAAIGSGDGPGAVELRLASGGAVRLGAADQLGAKLVAAETMLTQVDLDCLAVLDVRVPSAPTVTRDPGCG